MIRLVLFDIDGTLIQSGGAGEQAFARVCAEEFDIPDGTANLKFAGRTDTGIVRQFFVNHGIDPLPSNFARFFENYLTWLPRMLAQLQGRVLPGIQTWFDDLQALPQSPAIGLLTGNIRRGAEIKLSHYGLWHHFKTGGYGDDHEDRNQVAAVARDRANQFLGVRLHGEEIVVIGDTPLDVACARAIGAKVLAVATGTYSAAQLEEHRPDWTVEDLDQIQAGDICG